MKSIKNFVKEHKKEILLIGGTTLVVGGCSFICFKAVGKTQPVFKEACGVFTALPNDEMNTVDLFSVLGNDRNHLWVFSIDEAKALATELEDSIACLTK